MLLQREIQQMAEAEGVLPDTIDKDWVLGHSFFNRSHRADKLERQAGGIQNSHTILGR